MVPIHCSAKASATGVRTGVLRIFWAFGAEDLVERVDELATPITNRHS